MESLFVATDGVAISISIQDANGDNMPGNLTCDRYADYDQAKTKFRRHVTHAEALHKSRNGNNHLQLILQRKQ
jgi:hypothetical protein